MDLYRRGFLKTNPISQQGGVFDTIIAIVIAIAIARRMELP
jgi:hypothetical protein